LFLLAQNEQTYFIDFMERVKTIEKEDLIKKFDENFLKIIPSFYEMQSTFLSGIYKRYGDLEGGNIVIFFARDLHLEILRKREVNLDFDLSLEKFWSNHKTIVQGRKRIILVAKETGLPKETTRRKILYLIKKKHIKKGEKNRLFWEPASDHKETYMGIIDEQINSLSKFIFEQIKCVNINVPVSKIEKEIKKNYCFYWYNYLSVQLEYIKFWHRKLKDLEMLLIVFQVVIQTINLLKRDSNINLSGTLSSVLRKLDVKLVAGISATSISEITGIPRATCIRKLDRFVKMKILQKNKNTKRYSLLVGKSNQNNFVDSESIGEKVSLFRDFSSIIINALQK